MLAIAAALFLLVPVGVLAGGGGLSPHEQRHRVQSEVTDVSLAQVQAGPHAVSMPARSETLVEGHTAFVVLDVVSEAPPLDGSVPVEALLRCGDEPAPWFGLFGDEPPACREGARVAFVPSVYCAATGVETCDAAFSPDAPSVFATGRYLDVRTPNDERAYAEEFAFFLTGSDGVERVYYGWVTPVLLPWRGLDGGWKNVLMPLPADRLDEMGSQHFSAVLEERIRRSS